MTQTVFAVEIAVEDRAAFENLMVPHARVVPQDGAITGVDLLGRCAERIDRARTGPGAPRQPENRDDQENTRNGRDQGMKTWRGGDEPSATWPVLAKCGGLTPLSGASEGGQAPE